MSKYGLICYSWRLKMFTQTKKTTYNLSPLSPISTILNLRFQGTDFNFLFCGTRHIDRLHFNTGRRQFLNEQQSKAVTHRQTSMITPNSPKKELKTFYSTLKKLRLFRPVEDFLKVCWHSLVCQSYPRTTNTDIVSNLLRVKC